MIFPLLNCVFSGKRSILKILIVEEKYKILMFERRIPIFSKFYPKSFNTREDVE